MTDEETSTTRRAGPPVAGVEATGPSTAEYDEWSDERLVDGYRRNSVLLREYGTDSRTIRALCTIEERLRARGIDPDRIVAELEE